MRVLQIITSLNTGGAEKLMVDSVPIYQKESVNVDVLILSDRSTPFRKELEKNTRGKVIGLTKGSPYNPAIIFRLLSFFRHYDIIHAHLFPVLYWVVFAKVISFSKIPIVFTEHSTDNRRRSHFLLKWIDRYVYSKISFVGCISEGALRELRNHVKNNIHAGVITNGINIQKFSSVIIDRSLFCSFLQSDRLLIQVSSFRYQKDQETVIKALLHLSDEVKLLLVGDGPLRSEREEQVENLNLKHRVIFLGNRFDVPDLLNVSDIVILSSRSEGFGLAIVEGMAAKKPVIASSVTGLREIVENYGLLFEQGDDRELAEKINMLLGNQTTYNEIAKKCFLRAQDFSIEKMVTQYINIYKKVIYEK
jgi:glycosyltransferase involved in cell wall biosynthesis